MSASLVGSEMCIRDSLARRAAFRIPRAGPIAFRSSFEAWILDDRCFPSPVSYTHLTLPTICSV
eukprot:14232964-Alexandrium_andersonii.AAC.1